MVREGREKVTIEFLDPKGRSHIIHLEAKTRHLRDDEKEVLETGGEIPVFELD